MACLFYQHLSLQVSNTYQHQEINKLFISSPHFLIFLSISRFPGVFASGRRCNETSLDAWCLDCPWPPTSWTATTLACFEENRFEKNIHHPGCLTCLVENTLLACTLFLAMPSHLSLGSEEPLFEPEEGATCETIIIKTPSMPCCEQVHHAATSFFPCCAGETSRFILRSMQDIRFAWSSKAPGRDHLLGRHVKDSQQHQECSRLPKIQDIIIPGLQYQSMILCKRSMWAQWIRSVNDVPPSCFTSSRWPWTQSPWKE